LKQLDDTNIRKKLYDPGESNIKHRYLGESYWLRIQVYLDWPLVDAGRAHLWDINDFIKDKFKK